MKKCILLSVFTCLYAGISAQVFFDGNLKSTFSLYSEKVIDVRPDKSYFDKTGKFDSLQNQLWAYDFKPVMSGSLVKVKSDRKGGCLLAGEYTGAVAIGTDTLKPYSSKSVGTDVVLMHYNSSGQKDWWLRFSDYWFTNPTQFYADKVMDLESDGKYAYLTLYTGNGVPQYYIGPEYSDSFRAVNNLALLKIDISNGKIIWKKIPYGPGYSVTPRDLSVNSKGDVVLLYSSIGKLDWGNGVASPLNTDGQWLVKINADGTSSFISKMYDYATSSSTDDAEAEINDNGEIFFSGRTYGAYPNNVLGLPVNCNYIGMLKADGTLAWVRKFSNQTAYNIDIALHKNHIYFRGDITKTAKFIQSDASDSISISAGGNNNSSIYFGRFDNLGKLNWSVIGTAGSGQANGVPGIMEAIDDGSGVFCVGGFLGGSTFGSYSVPAGAGYFEKFILLRTENSSASAQPTINNGLISLYPNPTETGVIHMNALISGKAEVFNHCGQQVLSFDITSGLHNYNLDLSPGVYFIYVDRKSVV